MVRTGWEVVVSGWEIEVVLYLAGTWLRVGTAPRDPWFGMVRSGWDWFVKVEAVVRSGSNWCRGPEVFQVVRSGSEWFGVRMVLYLAGSRLRRRFEVVVSGLEFEWYFIWLEPGSA